MGVSVCTDCRRCSLGLDLPGGIAVSLPTDYSQCLKRWLDDQTVFKGVPNKYLLLGGLLVLLARKG